MPSICQARCNCCDYASEVFPAQYGAIFVDLPSADSPAPLVAGAAIFDASSRHSFAKQSDPQLVVLAHPIESAILKKTGYSWTTLAIAGRYVLVRRVACLDCGTLFDVKRLKCPSALGCQTGCISGIVLAVVVGLWWRNFWLGVGTACVVGLGCTAVIDAAGWLYTGVVFRARARALDGPWNCPHCGLGRYAGAERRITFPCPQCSAHSMQIRFVGMS